MSRVLLYVGILYLLSSVLLTRVKTSTGDGEDGDDEGKTHHDQAPSEATIDDTVIEDNSTMTNLSTTTTAPPTPEPDDIPGGSSEDEQDSGLTIFFILLVVGMCILLVHLIIKFKFHYLPESTAEVALGAFMGFLLMILKVENLANWQ
ncbi:uncharacterized protein LOC144359950, partial [Saccoglossus kowalevskii]